MALVKCKECGKEVSTEAVSCPHCGAPAPSTPRAVAKSGGLSTGLKIFLGFIVFMVVFRCSQSLDPNTPASQASPQASAKPNPPAPIPSVAPPPTSLPKEPSWDYTSSTDPMTSKTIRTAQLDSTNSINLDFPYKGANFGHLLVRSNANGKTEAMFYIDKGQTLCRSYEYSCKVVVRFDDDPPVTFMGIGPSDSSTEWAFLDQPGKFVSRAAKAKRIRVSMDIYKAGAQVFEFASPEPLRWPPKP